MILECICCILCLFIPFVSLNLWPNLWDKGITVSIIMNRKTWEQRVTYLYIESEKYLQKMSSTKHEQIWISEAISWNEQCVVSDLFWNYCCRNLANFAILLYVRRNMSYRDNKKKPSTFHIDLKLHGVGAVPSTGQQNGFYSPREGFTNTLTIKIPAVKFYRSTEANLCILHM